MSAWRGIVKLSDVVNSLPAEQSPRPEDVLSRYVETPPNVTPSLYSLYSMEAAPLLKEIWENNPVTKKYSLEEFLRDVGMKQAYWLTVCEQVRGGVPNKMFQQLLRLAERDDVSIEYGHHLNRMPYVLICVKDDQELLLTRWGDAQVVLFRKEKDGNYSTTVMAEGKEAEKICDKLYDYVGNIDRLKSTPTTQGTASVGEGAIPSKLAKSSGVFVLPPGAKIPKEKTVILQPRPRGSDAKQPQERQSRSELKKVPSEGQKQEYLKLWLETWNTVPTKVQQLIEDVAPFLIPPQARPQEMPEPPSLRVYIREEPKSYWEQLQEWLRKTF